MGKNEFKKYSWEQGEVKIKLNITRFGKQYEQAQFWLDNQVMTDMVLYMPHKTGTFINLTRQKSASLAGSGQVAAATGVAGRFLYEGKVMVDEITGSPWARKGSVKVVTDKDLIYSNPGATSHWFDTAKKNHGNMWISGVKKRAGGG